MQFSANISTLFTDYPFLQRFQKAKECGFKYVEIQSPYEYAAQDIARDLGGLKCVLVNSFTGPDDYGYASVPGKEYDFCSSLSKVFEYSFALGFKKVHIMSGLKNPNFDEEDQFRAFVSSLNSATDCLEDNDIIGLIEPICPEVNGNYFLSSFDTAVKVLEMTSNKNMKLLLDIYHLHKITGDVKKNLEKYYPYAGHIQISQDPGRTEPFSEGGKIDYKFVLDFLKEKNYQGFIGLEYFSPKPTAESFQWMKNYM